MGHRASVVADADAAVECRRAEPYRPLFLALIQHFPVPDVVAAVGAGAKRLFERKILAAAEVIEIADRRVLVGTIEQHAADDLDRRFQRDLIGRKPPGRMHRAHQILGVADQPDIDRIAGNALPGACHHRQASEAFLVLVMGPESGQDICEQAVGDQDRKRDLCRAPEVATPARWFIRSSVGHGDVPPRRS